MTIFVSIYLVEGNELGNKKRYWVILIGNSCNEFVQIQAVSMFAMNSDTVLVAMTSQLPMMKFKIPLPVQKA